MHFAYTEIHPFTLLLHVNDITMQIAYVKRPIILHKRSVNFHYIVVLVTVFLGIFQKYTIMFNANIFGIPT